MDDDCRRAVIEHDFACGGKYISALHSRKYREVMQ